jgi:hypothetical protein
MPSWTRLPNLKRSAPPTSNGAALRLEPFALRPGPGVTETKNIKNVPSFTVGAAF